MSVVVVAVTGRRKAFDAKGATEMGSHGSWGILALACASMRRDMPENDVN